MSKIYAIGDIHGKYDMLMTMLDKIQENGRIIFLGDYVDRGENSKAVLQTVLSMPDAIKIIGNHDMWMYEYLTFGHWDSWPTTYGRSTVESYNHDREMMLEDIEILCGENGVGCLWQVFDDGHLFTHSGGNPSKGLADQTTDDFLWYRPMVANHDYDIDGMYTVHGHTPVRDLWIGSNRCNVDTGCGKGGHLTCAEFDEGYKFPVKEHTVDMELNYKVRDIIT